MSLTRATRAVDAKARLKSSLSDFRNVLTKEEKVRLDTMAKNAIDARCVVELTCEIDQTEAGRLSRRISDRLHPFLDGIKQFTSAVDDFMDLGPTIARSTWAAVKLALLLMCNTTSYFEKLTDLLNSVGKQCPRYEAYTELMPGCDRLQHALCDYFSHVIRLCQQALKLSRKPAAVKLARTAIWPFECEFGPIKKDLTFASAEVSREIELAQVQVSKEEAELNKNERRDALRSRKVLAAFSTRVERDLEVREARKRTRTIQRIKSNLQQIDHKQAWRRFYKSTTPGTTEWFKRSVDFSSWFERRGLAALSITGSLGCGKSVLAANIVPYLQLNSPKGTAVAFYFCDDGTQQSLEVDAIMRSLMGQAICDHLDSFTSEDLARIDHLTANTYLDVDFGKLVGYVRSQYTHYIVMDNLDYCERNQADAILTRLRRLLETGAFKVLLVTRSNMRRLVSTKLPDCSHLHVTQSTTEDDMGLFVRTSLRDKLSFGSLRLSQPDLIDKIYDYLVIGAEGMFLWAYLMLEEICACRNDQAIIEILPQPPRKLASLFDSMLQRAAGASEHVSPRTLFAWLLGARRELSLAELCEAMSVRLGKRQLEPWPTVDDTAAAVSSMSGLVTYDEDESTVRLVHHSLRRFLLGDQGGGSGVLGSCFDEKALQAELAELCLTYLSCDFHLWSLTKRFESERPKVSLRDVTNIPQHSIEAGGSKLALEILKVRQLWQTGDLHSASSVKGRNAKNIEHQLDMIIDEMVQLSPPSASPIEYPFLKYAKEFWYIHGADLEPEEHPSAWELFKVLFRAGHGHYKQPWLQKTTEIPYDWLDWHPFLRKEEVRVLLWATRCRSPAIVRAAMYDYLQSRPRGNFIISDHQAQLKLLGKTLLRPAVRQMADVVCSFWELDNGSWPMSPNIRILLGVRFDLGRYIYHLPSTLTYQGTPAIFGQELLFDLVDDRRLDAREATVQRQGLPMEELYERAYDRAYEDYVRNRADERVSLVQLAIIYQSRTALKLVLERHDHPGVVEDAGFMALLYKHTDILAHFWDWMSTSRHLLSAKVSAGLVMLALHQDHDSIAAKFAAMAIEPATEDEKFMLCGAILRAVRRRALGAYEALLHHLAECNFDEGTWMRNLDNLLSEQFGAIKERHVDLEEGALDVLFKQTAVVVKEDAVLEHMELLWVAYYKGL